MEGKKYNEGKLRYSLLPNSVIRGVIRTFMFGSEKYEDDNWKKVEPWDESYYEASKRHINLWWDGFKYDGDEIENEAKRQELLENKDKSGLHHLDHAICCLIFLRWCDGRKERTKIGD